MSSYADNEPFVRGTGKADVIGAVVSASAPTTVAGTVAALSMDTSGALRVAASISGGGDASAANQTSQITQETAINTVLGVKTDAKSTSTDGTSVSAMSVLKQISASVQAPPSQAVTNAGTFATQESGTQVQVDDAAFTPATSKIVMAGFEADETATDSVDEGDGGAARMTLDRKQITAQYAHTAGGWTPVSTVSAASTNATSLKGSAGTVGYVIVTNVNAAVRYLKFYNKATSPTVGTDTPVLVIPMPGNTAGAGAVINFGPGIEFTTGIAWATTVEATVAGTTAVSASEHVISIGYK